MNACYADIGEWWMMALSTCHLFPSNYHTCQCNVYNAICYFMYVLLCFFTGSILKIVFLFEMNYSRALKGKVTRSSAIREITSQSELELGRPLSLEEETKILSKFSPVIIQERIQKVFINVNLPPD